MPGSPLFTIIMDTYYRPAYLKDAVEALFRQTYENLEIILVNNGATEETIDYLHKVERLDKRVKLIHFKENQFSWKDPLMMLDVCLNAGLRSAEGDYIWYQSDDDIIADDYADKMVALFQGNSDCTTAAGRTVAIDSQGKETREGRRELDYRSRYMPGHMLALDKSRGGNILYAAPSCIFTIKRDVFINAGGFHRTMPRSEEYGIVPFGVTGFDDTAIFYNRRHEGQLNLLTTSMGWTGSDLIIEMLKERNIEARWQVFGANVAREVVRNVKQEACGSAAERLVIQLYMGRFGPSWRVARKMWRHHEFWTRIFKHAWKRQPLRRWSRPWVRRIFKLLPALANSSSRLARLRERVNR